MAGPIWVYQCVRKGFLCRRMVWFFTLHVMEKHTWFGLVYVLISMGVPALESMNACYELCGVLFVHLALRIARLVAHLTVKLLMFHLVSG